MTLVLNKYDLLLRSSLFWMLGSVDWLDVTDVSEQRIGHSFNDCLIYEYGTILAKLR
jgi:hypothetical protein